jgi:hypothetical protein
MNFQQLQVVHEIAKRNFSLRDAAAALLYSQNNVRKHIKNFEGELGIQIFDRRGLDASPICGRMTTGLGLRPGYALTRSVYQVMQILVPQNFGSHSHSTAYPSSFFV